MGPPWHSTRISGFTVRAAAAQASLRGTQPGSRSAVRGPAARPAVSPRSQTRRPGPARDHRQHLARNVEHALVGVAVGQEAGERAAPGHAIASRVVDDDEVDATGLLAFRGQARAGAAADDRLAAAHRAAQPRQDVLTRNSGHGVLISLKFATSASANAWSLMWAWTFSSFRFVPERKFDEM